MTQQVNEQRAEIPPQPAHSDPAIHDWFRARRDDSPVYFDEMIRAWRVFPLRRRVAHSHGFDEPTPPTYPGSCRNRISSRATSR